MTVQDLGSLGEFVAAIATIATLIYLAIQIRQNTESTRTAAETTTSQNLASWLARGVNDPELGHIYDIAVTDPESLSEEETRRFLWYIDEAEIAGRRGVDLAQQYGPDETRCWAYMFFTSVGDARGAQVPDTLQLARLAVEAAKSCCANLY